MKALIFLASIFFLNCDYEGTPTLYAGREVCGNSEPHPSDLACDSGQSCTTVKAAIDRSSEDYLAIERLAKK